MRSRRPGSAAVFAVGDELTAGELHDANGPWLAERLAEHGFRVDELRCLPDDEPEIELALRSAAERRVLVVVTGGLGPTLDDVTRHAAARALCVDLAEDAETLAGLRAMWADRGLPMPLANARQALFPAGATILPNPAGTAPGFRAKLDGDTWLAVLPGPPREMRAVFGTALAAFLDELTGHDEVVRRARLYLFGLAESDFADRVGTRMARGANPLVGVLAGAGVLTVKIEARAAREDEAFSLLDACRTDLRGLVGEHVFSETTGELAEVVADELLRRGRTLATVESCTGGLLAERLTRVPGISASYLEGLVTYSNDAKLRLGVPAELLERHGAVSAEVAAALARAAAERSGARLAVSITGVAGPGGGSPEKPVGLVHFGLFADGELTTHVRRFPARGRDLVREFAANTGLDLVRRALLRPGRADRGSATPST